MEIGLALLGASLALAGRGCGRQQQVTATAPGSAIGTVGEIRVHWCSFVVGLFCGRGGAPLGLGDFNGVPEL
jgi:hypothetical protein